MDKPHVNRRSMLKGGATSLAFAALGGGPILGSMRHAMAASGLASEQLRTIGLSVTVQDRILQDFKKASDVGSVSGTAATFPDAQTKILSGSSDFDCWEIIGERLPALVQTNKDAPVETSGLKNWESIRDTFTKADPKWPAKAQIVGQIWTDDDHTKLYMVPAVYNYDSIGYNPDKVSAEEANTWTCLFDDKFKGKSGLEHRSVDRLRPSNYGDEHARPAEGRESRQPTEGSDHGGGEISHFQKEGWPVSCAVGRFWRAGESARLRRNGR